MPEKNDAITVISWLGRNNQHIKTECWNSTTGIQQLLNSIWNVTVPSYVVSALMRVVGAYPMTCIYRDWVGRWTLAGQDFNRSGKVISNLTITSAE